MSNSATDMAVETSTTIRVGVVAYAPKVVTIWEGMRDYFRESGVTMDYVLYSNYDALVDALFKRHIDLAWSTPVAYIRAELRADREGGSCQVLAMRDTDVDFTSRLLARSDSGIAGLDDLRGKKVAVGSADSAQAAILPVEYIRQTGIDPERDMTLIRFNLDVGKHGDTGNSEQAVLKALHEGSADGGFVSSRRWLGELKQGNINEDLVRSVWTSPGYSHCNFTALPDSDQDLLQPFISALMKMDYDDPRWRPIMDLEGVTSWVPGRKEGYEDLINAMR